MLPAYVQYGALVGEPPVACTNAVVWGFFLKADKAKVQALCSKVFEAPSASAVTCAPLAVPTSTTCDVMMTFSTIAAVKSLLGGVPLKEKEVLLQIPVKVNAPPRAPFNAFFAPYAWVDTPGSLTGGREIYGYAKSYGAVNVPSVASLPGAWNFALKTFGGNLGSLSLGLVPLIAVTSQGPVLNPIAAWTDLLQPLAAEFQTLLSKWSTGPNPTATQLFLKQFQDVDGAHACTQQITYADYTITLTLPAPVPLPSKFKVAIETVATHPLMAELGIASPQTVNGGFRFTEDFTLGVPKVLWP